MPVSDLFPLLPELHHGGLGDRGTGMITWGTAECPSELGKETGYEILGRCSLSLPAWVSHALLFHSAHL